MTQMKTPKKSFNFDILSTLFNLNPIKMLVLACIATISSGCGQSKIQETLHPDSFNCQNRVVDRLSVKVILKKPITNNLLVRVNEQTVIDECKGIKRMDFALSPVLLEFQGDGDLSNNDPTIEIFETECNPTLPNILRVSMGPQKAFARTASYQKTTGSTCSDPQLTHQFEIKE